MTKRTSDSHPSGSEPATYLRSTSLTDIEYERHQKAGLAFIAECEEKLGLTNDPEYLALVEKVSREYQEWDAKHSS